MTRGDLETLRWEEINPLLRSVAADKTELERLTRLAGEVDTPPAAYLRGLLFILQETPEPALAAFGSLDPETIPASLLYAPHRVHQTLHPGDVSPYLPALRSAVADGRVPPLIGARVQALDGELNAALNSYLRTDPGTWAAYDLDFLRRIAAHQGLAIDLRKLIAGALASGRVKATLVAPLQRLARQGKAQPDQEVLKEQLKREIEANTPAGRIAVESAKRLLNDRNLFLGKEYSRLVETHSEDDPMALPTETVLLLFLSAVELKEKVEMDRWGQELKRRHRVVEVRDWVNETMSAAR